MPTVVENTKDRLESPYRRHNDVGMDDRTRENGSRSDFFSVGDSDRHPDDSSVMER